MTGKYYCPPPPSNIQLRRFMRQEVKGLCKEKGAMVMTLPAQREEEPELEGK